VNGSFEFNWQAALDSIPYLLAGVPYTLLISFGGLAIGFLIGMFFGLLRLSSAPWLRWPAIVYIEVFRGTPVLVQVLFISTGCRSYWAGRSTPFPLASQLSRLIRALIFPRLCAVVCSPSNADSAKRACHLDCRERRHSAILFGLRGFVA